MPKYHGVRLNITRSLYNGMFRRYSGAYRGFQIILTETNDDPFGPVADYLRITIRDPNSGEIFGVRASKKKIRSKKKAVSEAMKFVDEKILV